MGAVRLLARHHLRLRWRRTSNLEVNAGGTSAAAIREFRALGGVDELNIGERLADRLGLGVGDAVTFESFTPEQVAATTGDFDPQGPALTFRIVGIVRRPLDLGQRGESLPVALSVLLVPVAVLVVNLIAAFPARSAARTRPATVLRSE